MLVHNPTMALDEINWCIATAALVGHKNSAQFQIARHLLSCRVSSGEDPLSIIESSKGRL
jgi:hypothetical protein